MPLKLNKNQIVIFKELPVLQCDECGDYLIEDAVMERIEKSLQKANPTAELEILNYSVN